jgi:hypothetical protein
MGINHLLNHIQTSVRVPNVVNNIVPQAQVSRSMAFAP